MYRVAVIVSSDSAYAGKREDTSGKKIVELCQQKDLKISEQLVLPDDKEQLIKAMKRICDQKNADLILTTGGTGLAPRDCMPEATQAVVQRNVPGISEAMRNFSMQITKRSMLSRGVSVIRHQTLIINLPGSPKAVEESLTYIIDQLPHAIGLIQDRQNEAYKY